MNIQNIAFFVMLLVSTTVLANAQTVECERYSTQGDRFFKSNEARDSWFLPFLSLPLGEFTEKTNSQSMVWTNKGAEINSAQSTNINFTLFKNGKGVLRLSDLTGAEARYKCDKKADEVRQLLASGSTGSDNSTNSSSSVEKVWIKVASKNSIGVFVDTNSKEIITKGSFKWYDRLYAELSKNPSRETRIGWIWSNNNKLEPDAYEFKNSVEPEAIQTAEFDGVKSFIIKSTLFDELVDAPHKYLYLYLKDYDDGTWFTSNAIESSCYQKPCIVVSNSSSSISTPTSSTSSSKLDKAKSTCTELGFTLGSEKHGECVLKMMDN